MAQQTLRIACIDSAEGNYFTSSAALDFYNNSVQPDQLIRPTYPGSVYSLIKDVTSSTIYAMIHAVFVFTQTDLSFLDTRRLISANVVMTPRAIGMWMHLMPPTYYENWSFTPDYSAAAFSSLGIFAPASPIQVGQASGMNHIVLGGSSAAAFKPPPAYVRKDVPIRFEVANLSSIKAIVQNGIYVNATETVTPGTGSEIRGDSMALYPHTDTANAPYIEIIYDDAPVPATVSATTPQNVVVDNTQELTFTWTYHQSYNQPQSHFDLQYNHNGTWEYLAQMVGSSEHRFTVPAGTLPDDLVSGETSWRVRSYIEDGASVSDWSNEAPFIVRSSPPTPNITIATNTPRPEFTWQSYVQNGYQMTLERVVYNENGGIVSRETVYSSAEIYGAETSWKYPGVLPDGNYIFMVRVINEFSLWSDWAQAGIYVENRPFGTIQLHGGATNNSSMQLNWNADEGMTEFYVLRDGAPIAKTSAKEFEDFTSLGFTEYVVRALSGGYYSDSNPITDTVKVKNGVVSTLPVTGWVRLEKRRGGAPEHSETITPDIAFIQYEDNETETGYTSGYKSEEHQLAFTFKAAQKYAELKKMCGRKVIYKDCHGARVIGMLGSLSARIDSARDFNFQIRRVGYAEAVEYD